MKFFANLPKITFTSTIGDFTISDFFTYLDVSNIDVSSNTITVDDRTTLAEAASRTYQDPNNLWTFLPANETINPFDLLAPNTFLFSEANQDKINLILVPSPGAVTGGTAFPVGSIIVPTTTNSGGSYQMGSTGNFNLSGGFALIEQSSYYDGNMVIGSQTGGTGAFITVTGTAENVTVLQKNSDGSFTWAGTYYTGNKKTYANKIETQILKKDAKTIYKESVSSNATLDTYLPTPTPVEGNTAYTTYSKSNNIENDKKQIKAYIPSQINRLSSYIVTAKYN